MNPSLQDLSQLPGGDLIEAGRADARADRETAESLLVEIASPRLASAGLPWPGPRQPRSEAELILYRLLGRTCGPEAYGQYNALLRRLVSFERALDHRLRLPPREG